MLQLEVNETGCFASLYNFTVLGVQFQWCDTYPIARML